MEIGAWASANGGDRCGGDDDNGNGGGDDDSSGDGGDDNGSGDLEMITVMAAEVMMMEMV